jgi:hypothetical protein
MLKYSNKKEDIIRLDETAGFSSVLSTEICFTKILKIENWRVEKYPKNSKHKIASQWGILQNKEYQHNFI